MKIFWRVGVILTVGLAGPVAAGPTATAIATAINNRTTPDGIPGAVVVVDRRGEPRITEFHGQTGPGGVPLLADTVIWVASLTKPIVATALMIMVEAGKVSLDDPVSRFIPDFKQVPMVRSAQSPLPPFVLGHPYAGPETVYTLAPAKRTLLVRDLVTMTAGLQTIGLPNRAIAPITPDDTLASWVPKLAAVPLDFEPGSRWGYSNATEFEVIARIVEIAAGEPFAAFVQHRIFDPLDMVDSSFGPRPDLAARTAPLGPMAANPIMMGRFASGSAGVLTTAGDYANFAVMLRDGGVFHGRRLLASTTVGRMASNQIGMIGLTGVDPAGYGGLQTRITPGIKYGLGLAVITDGPASGLTLPTGTFGWDGVGTRRMWVIPSLGTVIVMLVPGGEPSAAAKLHRDIEGIVTGRTAAQP